MKQFIFKTASVVCICMMMTACGQSGPSDNDVLNSYKDWVSSQAKLGYQVRQLPPEAIVDHCKKSADQPRGNGVLFDCFIKFGGPKDTNLNPVEIYHDGDGHWERW